MNPFRGLFRDLVSILPEKIAEPSQVLNISDPDRPAVVFVSGFGAPSRALRIMQRRLSRDGFNVLVFSMHWQDVSGGIPEMARALAQEVLFLKKRLHKTPIHLVAHSAGGIVARYYVQILGGSHYCDSLTTLATPHQGTWLSLLGFLSHLARLGRCLFQMSPRSQVLKKINTSPLPKDIRMISISSGNDLVCRSSTTELPACFRSLPNVKSLKVTGLSHSDFVLSRRGYSIIRKALESVSLTDDIFAAIHS